MAYIALEGILTESRAVSGSSSVVELLKKVERQRIKALLVRINSPGGTVGASQEIYSALRRLSEERGVAVVASMGDLAASGGIYVAMAADYIYAHPGTVTGSIGVIIKSGNIHQLLDRLGIALDSVKSGKYKDILSLDRAMTEEERAILQTTTDDTYNQFVETIAERRRLSVESVKGFADGRIFSGRQALEWGLIDVLGGHHKALERIRQLARLPAEGPLKLIRLEKRKSPLQKLMHGSAFEQALLSLLFVRQEPALGGLPLWLMPSAEGMAR